MSTARNVAQALLQIKAVKLSPAQPFTWASGILSPIYCDNRKTLSFPEVRTLLKEGFVELSKQFEPFDAIAGVATAGIPHGAILADALGVPFAYVRSKPKEHGLKNRLEGELPKGARILVVEDLISTGGSSLEAVEALRQEVEGAHIVATIAVFSYGFDKATTAFAAANCPFGTLCDYATLLAVAQEQGYISAEELATLNDWRSAPSEWRR